MPLAAFAAPASATGGLMCKTAGPTPIEIQLGFGHVPSPGLFLAKLFVDGREVRVEANQWWMQDNEVRLAMTDVANGDNVAILTAQWNDEARAYDGSIRHEGKKRWVRCRES